MARLYRVILPVSDIERAAAFYGSVLGESGQRVSEGRHYFGTGSDGAVLACYDPVADGDPVGKGWRQHAMQYVYFSVDDLGQAFDACQSAGASEISGVEKMPWGERLFYAKDPFGNPISFVQAGTEFTG